MEIIIAAIVLGIAGFFIYRQFDKPKNDGTHPLDTLGSAPYKVEPPVLTTVIDGIGHESVEVKPKATPAKTTKKKAEPKTKTAKVTAKVTAKSKTAKLKSDTPKKPKKKKAE